jgi:uncharacterized protein YlxP (DUF503 family)
LPAPSNSRASSRANSLLVGLGRFDLRIPGCGSLKEKRHVVKALTGAIRSRFEVSVAEVDHQELWQRTAIAVAVVGGQEFHVRKVIGRIESFVQAWGGVELLDATLTLHGPED